MKANRIKTETVAVPSTPGSIQSVDFVTLMDPQQHLINENIKKSISNQSMEIMFKIYLPYGLIKTLH